MAAQQGNVYETRNGFGIRWREGDQRRTSPASAPRPRRGRGSASR